VKGGRLVIEKGATGVTYSIQTGATCVVEDWNDGETKYYSAGTLTLRLDHASGAVYAGEYHLDGDNVTEVLQYPTQPASYIIFKSGSTYYAKNSSTGEVDYSGTSASSVINSAISALGSEGGTIFIRAGYYYLTSSISISKDDVSIIGEGKRSTILKINADGVDAIKITGTGITGTAVRRSFFIGHLAIHGKADRSLTGDGIEATNASMIVVFDVEFRWLNGSALHFNTVWNSLISNSYFMECGDFPTAKPVLDMGEATGDNTNSIRFTNCVIENFYYRAVYVSANSNQIEFVNCKFHGRSTETNIFDTVYADGYRIFIDSCYFTFTKGWAVVFRGPSSRISNSVIVPVLTNGKGVYLNASRCLAVNVEVQSPPETAFRADKSWSGFQNCIAYDAGGNGFELRGAHQHAIGCVAYSCDIGFYVSGATYFRIIGGSSDSATYDGVHITTSDHGVVSGFTSAGGRDGIRLTGDSDNNVLVGSRCTGGSGYGINISTSTCDNNDIRDNHLTGNTLGAINDAGTGTKIRDIRGYVTENSGSAVNSTSTTFVITHGLAETPTFVSASFNTTAIDAWTWTANSTTLTITVTPALTSPATVYWKAEVS